MKAGSRIFVLLGTLLLMVVACVKDPQDIPAGLSADPVFRLKGSLDQSLVSIGAGEGGWTMLPVTEKSDSLKTYVSVFSQDGCLQNCSPSWTFRFYEKLPVALEPASGFANTIHAGEKPWVQSSQVKDSFEITFSTHPALFMSGYSFWEDLNGAFTTFDHAYNTVVGYEETMNVCFQSLAYTGCQYTQCLEYHPSTLVPCLVWIEPTLENARYLSLHAKPQGTPPFQYQWYNGSASSTIVVPLTDSASVVYAEVIVTDAVGNSTYLQQTVKVENGYVDACYFPIEFNSQVVENSSIQFLADHVEIEYRDANGNTWKSREVTQDAGNYFIIDSVTPYGDSPFNEPAYKIEGRTKVLLFNVQTGESKVFESDQLVLALSHP